MQYFGGLFYHSTPQACISDLTPPTFAGIATIAARPNGSLRATWLAGSDATPPVRYRVYVKDGTATGLFSAANIAAVVESGALTVDVYALGDATLLVKGHTYYVGVRAVDALGNEETNLASLSAISTGVLDDDLATIAANLSDVAAHLSSDLAGVVLADDLLEGVIEEGPYP